MEGCGKYTYFVPSLSCKSTHISSNDIFSSTNNLWIISFLVGRGKGIVTVSVVKSIFYLFMLLPIEPFVGFLDDELKLLSPDKSVYDIAFDCCPALPEYP